MSDEEINHARIGTALGIVRLALRPYVEQQLLTAYGDRWPSEVANTFRVGKEEVLRVTH